MKPKDQRNILGSVRFRHRSDSDEVHALVDIKRLESHLDGMLFDLGLMGQDGDVINDIDNRLTEISSGGVNKEVEVRMVTAITAAPVGVALYLSVAI